MRKWYKYSALVVVLLMSYSFVNNDRLYEISKNIEIFVNVYKELNTNYVDDVDPSELMRKGLDAMVGSLDPYTNYISESQIESYRISDDSKYQGIGATIIKVGDRMILSDVKEGSPALEIGVQAGDEVKQLNGTSIAEKTASELNALLRGVVGTPVKIEVAKLGTKETAIYEIERGEVNIPNVPYSGFVSDDIGYISLTTFTQNAGANISKGLKELKDENPNLEGIIIDLRNNGGGLLREAISICNLFVPKGVELVTTKGKVKENDHIFRAMKVPEDLEIPIVVLVNDRSASASEIVSGSIQDLDRGVIMGQRSFGKGLVQNYFELGYNSRMKVTISKYYIPSGRCIQGVEYEDGIPVDIPDEKRSKFKTKNGRTVLDGGGVTPDVKLSKPQLSEYTKALLSQNVIFDFVSDYVVDRDTIKDLENFSFSGYEDFLIFVKDSKFDYVAMGQKEIEDLAQKFEESDNFTSLSPKVKQISMDINALKAESAMKYKEEIVHELEKEIAARYQYDKGRTQMNLRRDTEVAEAIKLLNDPNRYKSLLRG